MKKALSLFLFFIISFLILFTNKVYAYDYSQSCYKESVEQLAKILLQENVGTFPGDPDNEFFVNACVAAVIINNANVDYQTNNMASKSNWDKKIYYLLDRVYANHSRYRDNTLESIERAKGLESYHGQVLYLAALALSGKYTFPTNMMGQAAPYLAQTYCEPANGWHIFDTKGERTEICYVSGVPKSDKDVFGNTISDDSFEHYQALAKSLMRSDYSEYTLDNVCSKVAGIKNNTENNNNNNNNNKELDVHACENPDILKVIFFAKLILNIVKIIIPVGLIIMGMIDFSKSVITNDENSQKKNVKMFFKRIMFAIIVFAVPWIVETLIVNLGNLTSDVNYTDCLENANEEKITELENRLKNEETKTNNNENDNTGGSNKESGEMISPNDVTFVHLDKGTENIYFSPIQNINNYEILSANSTPGCYGNVYHDITKINVGTPIYAGIDGIATFMQAYITSGEQKNKLYSYGNHIRLTSSDGETTIIYAHLQKFAKGINAPITETCAKKSDGSVPCSANSYSGTTKVVATYKVKKGDLIGYLGDTGNSIFPHLHVEIKKNGACVTDPFKEFGLLH